MSGRIRTVKPEWLEDERMASQNDTARVLSIVLILVADDYGRGRASAAHLASAGWAYELERDDGEHAPEVLRKVSGALRALVEMRFVTLYEVDGQRYFEIRNWEKHQKVSHKGKERVPAPSTVVSPPCVDSGKSPEGLREVSVDRPATLLPDPDLRPGSPITDPEGDLAREAPPASASDSFGRKLETIRAAFVEGFLSTGEHASPWILSLTGAHWQDVAGWLAASTPGREPETARQLGRGFAMSKFARSRGYRFRGSGGLIEGPGEFLVLAGGVAPSAIVHTETSDEDFEKAMGA